MTPTLKLKRRVVAEHFADEIEELYSELEAAGADVGRRVPAGERGDLDHVARVRRVDEAAAADVDPDVAEPVEEDEVAGLELGQRDRAAVAVLRVRAVRQRDARSGRRRTSRARSSRSRTARRRPRRTACRGTASRSRRRRRAWAAARRSARRRGRRADRNRGRERGLPLGRLLGRELRLELALERGLPGGLGRLQVRDLALDRAEQLLALAELRLDGGARRRCARATTCTCSAWACCRNCCRCCTSRRKCATCLSTSESCSETRSLASIRPSMSSRLDAPSRTARPAFWSPEV